MKRITKVLLAGLISVLAILFVQNVINLEIEPYYTVIIFLMIAGAFGLLENK